MANNVRELPFEPGYGVSQDGRAWCNIPIGRPCGKPPCDWRPLKGRPMGPGEYLAITVNRNGKRARAKNHYIHQLVLRMFGDTSPSPEHEVRHMDGDNLNNAIGNLAWGTRVENTQDKKLHGTFHEGERHGMAKLDEPTVIDIRRRHRGGESQTSIAKSLSVQQPQISRIVNRKLWTHIA